MSDRHDLTACGICGAPAGEACDYPGIHRGRRWEIGITSPGWNIGGDSTLDPDHGLCRPTVETKDRPPTDSATDRRGHMVWRGACLGCGWHGPTRDDENEAVADAHDHTMPGWRNLPPVPKHPTSTGDDRPKSRDTWFAAVTALYTAHGIDVRWLPGNGAPIRTYRQQYAIRSHWLAVIGGFDISAGIEPEHVDYTPQLTLFDQ